MNTVFFVILGILGIIYLGIILTIYMIFIKNYKAFNNIWMNSIHCGKIRCPEPSLKHLEVPNQINNTYNKDMALYCADLVYRVHKMAHNSVLSQPKHLTMVTKLWNIKENPIFGIMWSYSYKNIHPIKKIVFISFRGTIISNFKEWSQDLQFDQKNFIKPNKKHAQSQMHFLSDLALTPSVHGGFLDVYNKLRPSILQNLKQIKPDQVIVTGHSLGAAVATICALDLFLLDYNTVSYTLASPRVGDNIFANLVNSSNLPLFRIVNSSDIIPTLPPAVFPNFDNPNQPLNYTHCGELINFNDNWESYLNNHLLPVYIKFLQKP